MTDKTKNEYLRPWSPATYEIKVQGMISDTWADLYAGMRITTHNCKDESVITCLTGRMIDQQELTGVLNNLAEMHLPILSVKKINEKGDKKL